MAATPILTPEPKLLRVSSDSSAAKVTTTGGCPYNQDRGKVFVVEYGAAAAASTNTMRIAFVADGHGGTYGHIVADHIYNIAPIIYAHLITTADRDGVDVTDVKFLEKVHRDCIAELHRISKTYWAIGSTFIAVIITDTHYVVANVGDSIGLIISGGKLVWNNTEHTAESPTERDAILKRCPIARFTTMTGLTHPYIDYSGSYIMVSRAIGDSHMDPAISHEPDVSVIPRDLSQQEYVFLMSDGMGEAKYIGKDGVEKIGPEVSIPTIAEAFIETLSKGTTIDDLVKIHIDRQIEATTHMSIPCGDNIIIIGVTV